MVIGLIMESIEYGLLAICLVSGVCYFISTFIYLPFYMLLLKLREPDMYKELDGISVFIPISFFLAPMFFCNKKYRESSNKWVVFHGEV